MSQPTSAPAAALRGANWEAQRAAGIDLIPVNDFSFYDQVLDAAWSALVPARYQGWRDGRLDTYFAMARGATRGPMSRRWR